MNVKKVSLELGGKSPLIIFSDCDIDKAVRMVGCKSIRARHSLKGKHDLCVSGIAWIYKFREWHCAQQAQFAINFTVSPGYLKVKIHPKLMIFQSKFSGPRKFTMRCH